MGLFYTALERAEEEQAGAKPGAAAVSSDKVVDAEPEVPPPSWAEAEHRDLAGFAFAPPLMVEPAVVSRAAEAAAPPAAQLDGARLCLAPLEGGLAREQYRILRTRVLEAMGVRAWRSLLITSAGAVEGKTTVAANLALQCAALKQVRVLLVDADLRRAGLTEGVRPEPNRGLLHYLKGEAALDELLVQIEPWLTVLPTQRAQGEAAELLASQRMVEGLRQLCVRFDLVMLDGAPIGPVADSRILSRMCDASLLVAREGAAAVWEVERAATLLGPTLVGSVLNGAKGRERDPYGYVQEAVNGGSEPREAGRP